MPPLSLFGLLGSNLSCVSDGPGIILDSDLCNKCCTLVFFFHPLDYYWDIIVGDTVVGDRTEGMCTFYLGLEELAFGWMIWANQEGNTECSKAPKCLFVDDSRKRPLFTFSAPYP